MIHDNRPLNLALAGLRERAYPKLEALEEDARVLWGAFCAQRTRKLGKPASYAAALEYLVAKRAGLAPVQGALAEAYGAKQASVSKQARAIQDAPAPRRADVSAEVVSEDIGPDAMARAFLMGMLEQMADMGAFVDDAEFLAPDYLDALLAEPQRARALHQAARRFASARPWEVLREWQLVEVTCDAFRACVKVTGEAGEIFGLSIQASLAETLAFERVALGYRADAAVSAMSAHLVSPDAFDDEDRQALERALGADGADVFPDICIMQGRSMGELEPAPISSEDVARAAVCLDAVAALVLERGRTLRAQRPARLNVAARGEPSVVACYPFGGAKAHPLRAYWDVHASSLQPVIEAWPDQPPGYIVEDMDACLTFWATERNVTAKHHSMRAKEHALLNARMTHPNPNVGARGRSGRCHYIELLRGVLGESDVVALFEEGSRCYTHCDPTLYAAWGAMSPMERYNVAMRLVLHRPFVRALLSKENDVTDAVNARWRVLRALGWVEPSAPQTRDHRPHLTPWGRACATWISDPHTTQLPELFSAQLAALDAGRLRPWDQPTCAKGDTLVWRWMPPWDDEDNCWDMRALAESQVIHFIKDALTRIDPGLYAHARDEGFLLMSTPMSRNFWRVGTLPPTVAEPVQTRLHHLPLAPGDVAAFSLGNGHALFYAILERIEPAASNTPD